MRRVLVPLDGSEMAEGILPDARRLAGTEGELVLVRDVGAAVPHHLGRSNAEPPVGYLETVADGLRSQGARVQTQMFHMGDAAVGIDEAAGIFQADMIAIATHDRSLMHRLLWGGVAWRALAHSPIPVLLRRLETPEDGTDVGEPQHRHTLVPLDGSQLESAPAGQATGARMGCVRLTGSGRPGEYVVFPRNPRGILLL